MAAEVHYELDDGIAVVTLDRPVANALSATLRSDLRDALERAFSDAGAGAVVLRGAGTVFSSGVDIAEYDHALSDPWISDLCIMIETAPKPVVAAIHGAALGAGFELALAAHARVVQRGTRLALPEVTLGLVPGAGGTQRLPRLVGAQASLEIMLSGKAVGPEDRRLSLIFTRIVERPPFDDAKAVARQLMAMDNIPRTREIERGFSDPEGYQRAVNAVASQLTDAQGAEAAITRCVEAAQLLPFERGLDYERQVFEDRIASPQARGIRHTYTSERRAAIMPELGEGRAASVGTVALAANGQGFADIVVSCLDRGSRVAVLSDTPETAREIVARTRTIYDSAVARGRLEAAKRDERLARLSHGADPSVLATADLVLDSGEVALQGALAGDRTVWAVMDEAAPAAARAARAGAARRGIALRLYRPAYAAKLAEIAVPEGTSADAVATLVQYLASGGLSILRSIEVPGMLGHNLMGAGLRAALALVRAGADPYEVEAAARGLGFAHGPFRMIETEGIAPVLARLRRLAQARGLTDTPELTMLEARQAAVDAGKTPGRGFFAAQGQGLVADPGLGPWLEAWRQADGLPASGLPDVPLAVALNAALVNEGARQITARAVLRPSDIDLCLVRGYGFDRARGGPLLLADIAGLLGLVRAMKQLAPLSGSLWEPQPLVEDLVKYGRRFFGPVS